MTNEEAIELINQLYMRADFTDEYGDFDDTEPYQEAIDFITDLLKNVGGDCISRKAVLNAMYELCDTGESLKENKWRDNPHIDAIVDVINELPTIPQTDLPDILIKEYLSKCECCDECFAEYFCIKNDLRESREPKDYCIENIKQYLSVRNSERDFA